VKFGMNIIGAISNLP